MKDFKIRGRLETWDTEINLIQPNGEVISLIDLIGDSEGLNIEITGKEVDQWEE